MWPGIHDMPYKYENNMLTWEKKEVKNFDYYTRMVLLYRYTGSDT